MSARPGPGGGYRATGIPTAISRSGSKRNRLFFDSYEIRSIIYGVIAQFVPDFCRRARLAMASWFLLSPLLCGSQSQPYSVLCSAGAGNFDSEFPTGVRVHIGATRNRVWRHALALQASI